MRGSDDSGSALTEHSPGRNRLPVEPEGHLREDDSHDAGQVRLDHEVADLPLQVEMGRHDRVLACVGGEKSITVSRPTVLGIITHSIGRERQGTGSSGRVH